MAAGHALQLARVHAFGPMQTQGLTSVGPRPDETVAGDGRQSAFNGQQAVDGAGLPALEFVVLAVGVHEHGAVDLHAWRDAGAPHGTRLAGKHQQHRCPLCAQALRPVGCAVDPVNAARWLAEGVQTVVGLCV